MRNSPLLRPGAPLLLLTAALLSACQNSDAGLSRVSVIGDQPKLIENVTAPLPAGDAVARSALAQGLVRFDSKGQIVPGLAERWNVSDDGLSYIFRLKQGNWPDGRKIKAADVARILGRQIRPANGNPLADTLGAVSEVVAMTDRVIEIRLITPRPNLLQLLAQPDMGIVRDGGGGGPFAAMKADAANMTGLALEHRIPVLDSDDIVERVQLTGTAAQAGVQAFKAGRLDLLLGGTFDTLGFAQKGDLPRAAVRYDPAIGLFGLVPGRKSAMTEDRDVRRLLSRTIDRSQLIAQLQIAGLAPRATILQVGLDGMPPPVQPDWLGERKNGLQAQRATEAREVFRGYDSMDVSLFLPDGPGGDLLFQRLATDWSPLGLTVTRASDRKSADYVLIDEVAPSTSPAWFLRRFRCAVVPICVQDAESILADARQTPNAGERAALFAAAATKMDEAQIFIPITAPIRWSLVARGLDGFIENPFARHTLVGLKDTRARENAQ
nr:ABC transporter substrate-binding protein [uncultured Sphingomonas sp.]